MLRGRSECRGVHERDHNPRGELVEQLCLYIEKIGNGLLSRRIRVSIDHELGH